jgi:hypothetical protein
MQFSPPVGSLLPPPLLLCPCRLHVLFPPPFGSRLPLYACLEIDSKGLTNGRNVLRIMSHS